LGRSNRRAASEQWFKERLLSVSVDKLSMPRARPLLRTSLPPSIPSTAVVGTMSFRIRRRRCTYRRERCSVASLISRGLRVQARRSNRYAVPIVVLTVGSRGDVMIPWRKHFFSLRRGSFDVRFRGAAGVLQTMALRMCACADELMCWRCRCFGIDSAGCYHWRG